MNEKTILLNELSEACEEIYADNGFFCNKKISSELRSELKARINNHFTIYN